MTNSAIASNLGGFAWLQELLRLRRVMQQVLPQLVQAFQSMWRHDEAEAWDENEIEESNFFDWTTPLEQMELLVLFSDAFSQESRELRDLGAFVKWLARTQQALVEHWRSLPTEVQQQWVSASNIILNLLYNFAPDQSQLSTTETASVHTHRSFPPLLRYLRTTWTIIEHPRRNLEHVKELMVALPQFARTIQRLDDRDRAMAEFRKLESDDWERERQIERNQAAIAWIQERRRKDDQMTEEEEKQAIVEFEQFKQIIDEGRPPGNRLYTEE